VQTAQAIMTEPGIAGAVIPGAASDPYRSAAMSSTLVLMGAEVDDATLMLRYARGDVRAFELLYERHKGSLYRYLLRLCRSPDLANDLFQEAWGKVIATRARYQAKAQFNTYLFHIAHNCAIDHFRRASSVQERSSEDADGVIASLPAAMSEWPETQAVAAQVRADFAHALAALPQEQREAFVLYEETGMSLEEIGKVSGVTMETAKSRLRYAVAKLRAALSKHRPDRAEPQQNSQAAATQPLRSARGTSPGVEL
jgi:RNA polymerase sigma-70 factor (ECF subfamily)